MAQVMQEDKARSARLLGRVAELEERVTTLTTHLRNNEKQYREWRKGPLPRRPPLPPCLKLTLRSQSCCGTRAR